MGTAINATGSEVSLKLASNMKLVSLKLASNCLDKYAAILYKAFMERIRSNVSVKEINLIHNDRCEKHQKQTESFCYPKIHYILFCLVPPCFHVLPDLPKGH